jgi:F subunit of K+-transporting ATPase (Potass_KdpF)
MMPRDGACGQQGSPPCSHLVHMVQASGLLTAFGRKVRHMGLEYLLTGLVALGIAVYLAIALLKPDKF